MAQEHSKYFNKDIHAIDDFSRRVNSFPKKSQDFIAFLSSMFLEKDVFEKTQKDPDKVDRIEKTLQDQGLPINDISEVLKHFDLSIKEKYKFPKEHINEIGGN